MAATNATVNNFNIFGVDVSIFDVLPAEILIMIAKECRPEDLYKLINTSTRFYNLVVPNASHYACLYANVMQLDVEKFMWNLFDDDLFNNDNKEQLFLKMLNMYLLSNCNYMGTVWQQNNMEYDEDYGPLPEDPIELYIKNFQFCLIKEFSDFDLLQSAKLSFDSDPSVFDFLFKFIKKYPTSSNENINDLVSHIEDFIEQNMDYYWVDEYIQEAISYNADEEDIFDVLTDGDYIDEYLKLLSYGVNPERAKYDVHSDEYTDEQLEDYNSIRHIIGNKLAHYYILDYQLDVNTVPNFLENVVRIRSYGIEDENIINAFLQNPTNELLEYLVSYYVNRAMCN
jgi:hypothetical protein